MLSYLWKKLLFLLVMILMILFYFLYTSIGLKHGYALLSYGVSKHLGVDVDIESINVHQYPFVHANLRVKKQYQLYIQGRIRNKQLNMTYTVQGKLIKAGAIDLNESIELNGTINGHLDNLRITGRGKALSGDVRYSLNKQNKTYRDISLTFSDVNSTKLFSLLEQKPIFKGKATAQLNFDYMHQAKKRGRIYYAMNDNSLYGHPTDVLIEIDVKDMAQLFTISLYSPAVDLKITQGTYDQKQQKGHAGFTLTIAELSKLKELLGKTYKGPLSATGQLAYDKILSIKGISHSASGKIPFEYKGQTIHTTLNQVPLHQFGKIFGSEIPIDGNLSGTFTYDFKKDNLKAKHFTLNIPKHQIIGAISTQLGSNLDLVFEGSVDKHYALTLKGLLGKNFVNMDYTLQSKRVPSPMAIIVDDIYTQGHLNGSIQRLHITGKGTALDGNISYEVVKRDQRLENVIVEMHDIRTRKLSTLLGYPDFPDGKSTLFVNLDTLTSQKQQGNFTYEQKGKYKTLPFVFKLQSKLKGRRHTFDGNISLADTAVSLSNGYYDLATQKTHLSYQIHSPDLSQLSPVLEFDYLNDFDSNGTLAYQNKLHITGSSYTYGGLTTYTYQDKRLEIILQSISFKKFMRLFSYPKILEASTSGVILYDFEKSYLKADTKLGQAKLLPSSVLKILHKKANLDLSKEIFDDSSFKVSYHKGILIGDLNLSNQQGYMTLSQSKINTTSHTIDANFDVNLQDKSFSGKIQGTVDHPIVKLNMRKLIRHEMNKQLDSYIGKDNHKLMKSMPMGDVAEDMAAEMGAGLIDMFF